MLHKYSRTQIKVLLSFKRFDYSHFRLSDPFPHSGPTRPYAGWYTITSIVPRGSPIVRPAARALDVSVRRSHRSSLTPLTPAALIHYLGIIVLNRPCLDSDTNQTTEDFRTTDDS